jgi:hypothetical protein
VPNEQRGERKARTGEEAGTGEEEAGKKGLHTTPRDGKRRMCGGLAATTDDDAEGARGRREKQRH